jgi:hypothetical protein
MGVAAGTATTDPGGSEAARLPGASRREVLLALVLFSLLALVVFSQIVFGGRVLITSDFRWFHPWREHPEIAADTGFRYDSAQSYFPRRLLSREALLRGEAPLWNPHAALGMPLLADYQTAPFYPPNLLLLPLDPLTAMGVFMVLHAIAAGVFAFVFLRGLGIGPLPAAFGALAFQWNGYFISYFGHPTHVATGVWLPLLLHLARRALLAPRGFPLAFALALASLLLAGFPQTLVYSLYALAAFSLFVLAVEAKGPLGARAARAVPLAAAGIAAVALAAPEWLPSLQLSRLSLHAGFTHDSVWMMNDIPFATYVKALFPDFFGNPLEGTSWLAWAHGGLPHPNDLGAVAYAGILTPLCALIGLARAARRGAPVARGQTLFFAGLAVVPVLFMSVEPASRLLWRLPGWGFSTEIHRIEFLIFVAEAVLAARGLEALLSLDPEGTFARRVLALLVGLLVAFLVAFHQFAERLLGGIGEQMLMVLRYAGKGSRALWVTPRVLDFISSDIAGWVAEVQGGVFEGVAVASAGAAIVVLMARAGGGAAQRAAATPRARPRGPAAVLAALLLVLHAADLAGAARRYLTPQPRAGVFVETEGIRAIQAAAAERPGRLFRFGRGAVLPPNIPSVFGLDDAGGYNALLVEEYGRYADAIERGAFSREREVIAFENTASLDSPLFRLMAAPYLLVAPWREAAPLFPAWPFRDAAQIRLSRALEEPGGFSLAAAGGEPGLRWNVPGEATIPFPGGAGATTDSVAFRWETGSAGSARFEAHVSAPDTSWALWSDVVGQAGGPDSGWVAARLGPLPPEALLALRVVGVAGASPPVILSRFRLARALPAGGDGRSASEPAAAPGGYRLRYAGDLALFETDRALPRARLLTRFAVEPDRDVALQRLAAGEVDVASAALLESRPALEIAPSDAPLPAPRIARSAATRVDVETSADAPAILVLADLFYPGWEATIDGTPTRILRANSVFRAVAVPAGRHTVSFRFVSPPYRQGCLAAAAALVALPITMLIARRRRGRPRA